LWELYHGRFERSLPAMRRTLIDDHPAGWSTINRADWHQKPGFVAEQPCGTCGSAFVKHLEWPPGAGPGQGVPATGRNALGHAYERDQRPQRPQCLCHGDRHEEDRKPIVCKASRCDGSTCDPGFIMWVYGLEDDGLRILSCARFAEPPGYETKSLAIVNYRTGALEQLPRAWYRHRDVGLYPWKGAEPDWKILNRWAP